MIRRINIRDFRMDGRILEYLWVILLVLFVDQLIKVAVYRTILPHEELRIIGEWFRIRLELNDGTAFSNLFAGERDRYVKILTKVLLTAMLFACLAYFLKKRSPKTLPMGLALCLGGSIGNLIDRVFHGVVLDNALRMYSTRWFHGQVIDVFYLPLFKIRLPNWMPLRGGEDYVFWLFAFPSG